MEWEELVNGLLALIGKRVLLNGRTVEVRGQGWSDNPWPVSFWPVDGSEPFRLGHDDDGLDRLEGIVRENLRTNEAVA